MDFAPSVYEHAARLIECRPWNVSRDPDLLYRAHARACELYHHNPVVVGIDIYNLEAEAYGAVVAEPTGNGIPAISRHPLANVAELRDLPTRAPVDAGRIPMVLSVADRLAGAFPEADVRVPVSGPFSIATNLIGFEALLCECVMEPDGTREALLHLGRAQEAFCQAVLGYGLNIAFFESAAAPPLISPDQFRDIELPALKDTIERASRVVGRPVPCIIGGDTYPILDSLMETGTGYVICPAETDQARFMAAMDDWPEVMVRVNTRPAPIAEGDMARVRAEADRVLELARGRERVCIGTGALPFETNPAVVQELAKYCAAR